jgi:hypothetical protein
MYRIAETSISVIEFLRHYFFKALLNNKNPGGKKIILTLQP